MEMKMKMKKKKIEMNKQFKKNSCDPDLKKTSALNFHCIRIQNQNLIDIPKVSLDLLLLTQILSRISNLIVVEYIILTDLNLQLNLQVVPCRLHVGLALGFFS
jgi:hypothetical protein